ncbi:unnamed protein product [Alternaria alternata]
MAPSTNGELSAFLEHVEKRKLFAIAESPPTGTRPIVSIRALQTYLSTDRVRKLLLYINISSNYERIVRDRYLVVFSVLLSIHRGPYITSFVQYDQLVDERLPFLSRDDWPEVCKVIFDEFYEAQWKFCAKRLVYDRLNDTRLHADEIVPFRRKDVLKAGPDSTIFKAELFEEYNYLFPDEPHPPTNVFILKSCPSDNTKLHNNEVEAYRTLLSHSNGQDAMQNMARFYGSWIQRDNCYILREYVSGGTLTEFFERTQPPTSANDILKFWTNFIQLIKPISCIHRLPDPHDQRSFRVGLHNDIKPDNILVSEMNNNSPFDVSYKLMDLGLAGFVLADDSDETQIRDVHGTKMYSAPEYFRGETDMFKQRSIKQAHPSKDIWALACVISEAAVWSVFGYNGLIDYYKRRIFLIDDSASMQQHWKEVKKVFEALAYLVKLMDPDGIELRFANSCEHDGREKNRNGLIRKFERVKPGGQCQMGIALNKILPNYYQTQNKRVSWSFRVEEKPPANIYILTDGVWSQGPECLSTVQEHIIGLVNQLSATGKLEHVGIQFIRFGDDEVGKQRLDILDNDKMKYYDVPRDIVDTEPSTGNIFKMLLGSTDGNWDRQDSG